MSKTRWLSRMCTAALVLAALPAAATSSADLDIGEPPKAGSSAFANGVYTVSGSGENIWDKSDQFHFNHGALTGDGTVTALVGSVGNTSRAAKCGVMLRADITPSAAFADVVVTPGSGVLFQSRTHAGRDCISASVPNLQAPLWVRLTRRGNSVAGSFSRNGLTWTPLGKPRLIALGGTALAGLAVASHNKAALCTSIFTHVAVTPKRDSRYLHTSGIELRDRVGRLVTLRGTNIGGWLVTEGWMCGQTDNGGRFALEQLEARFGAVRAATLINAWRDGWFTDRDFDNIRSYGFNLIRVPFSWRNLQDADGKWYRDAQGNIDFSRFDWTVQEAAKRGIYVVFVYHIWPGQQKNYGDICQAGEPGNTQRAASVQLWSEIAKHFKGNGTVAAFDLINEPTGSNDHYAAHRAFYAAIRAQDPERMLAAEWVNTADFAGLGWTNTLCSGHYPAGNKADFETFLHKLPDHNEYSTTLPCFVGECKSDDSQNAMQNAVDMTQAMNRLGWAWATWTYKTVNMGGWGLFDYDGSMNYNLSTDSYGALLAKWQTGLTLWQDSNRPHNYSLKNDIIQGLQSAAITLPHDHPASLEIRNQLCLSHDVNSSPRALPPLPGSPLAVSVSAPPLPRRRVRFSQTGSRWRSTRPRTGSGMPSSESGRTGDRSVFPSRATGMPARCIKRATRIIITSAPTTATHPKQDLKTSFISGKPKPGTRSI